MDTNAHQPVRFGPWLESQMLRREWNQSELARRLNVRPAVVSRWIRDERRPSTGSVDKIADVLGLDVDLVLSIAGHRPRDIDLDPESATARLMPLIEKIDWQSRPGRLEEMEAELRFMIEIDQRKNAARKT